MQKYISQFCSNLDLSKTLGKSSITPNCDQMQYKVGHVPGAFDLAFVCGASCRVVECLTKNIRYDVIDFTVK